MMTESGREHLYELARKLCKQNPMWGIGWGGFIAVNLIILRKIVSSSLIVKAISLLTIALSVVNGVITISGTSVYSVISLPYFYLLLSGVMLIGIIIMNLINFDKVKEGVVDYED